MGLKQAWKALFYDNRVNHSFSDEERSRSREMQRLNIQHKQLQAEIEQMRLQQQLAIERAKLEELQDDLYGEEEEEGEHPPDMGQMMMMMLLKQAQGDNTAAPAQAPQVAPTLIRYTDEQIADILGKIPKAQRVMLKHAPEALLRVKMRELFNADDDSIERAVKIVLNA